MRPAAGVGAAFVLGLALLAGSASGSAPERFDAAAWRKAFARPAEVFSPPDNPVTPAKVELGRRLFEDPRLSGNGQVSCATCHQPLLSFSDGVALRAGLDGKPLPRRVPQLWNLSWGLTFFWDGRAASLEQQALGPIVNPREMAGDLSRVVATLRADPDIARRFALAFPADPQISDRTIGAALAAFERTLVSPRTRFDAWVEGDDNALDADELGGLRLFVGKAGCVACHRGWRFTDDAFHDIGLPSADLGRGGVLNLAAANHAFKTPGLRERVWTAPYMHDGSLASLDEVVAHYADRRVERPTLSRDLPRRIELSPAERRALVAFLTTLSSDDPPRPASLPAKVQTIGAAGEAVATHEVRQHGRRFSPDAVALGKGESLTVVNDDTRTHNVRVDDPRMPAFSEAQEPGDSVVLAFPQAGVFDVICGIHPDMRLRVVVR